MATINAGAAPPFVALFDTEGVVWADAYAWGYYELTLWLEAQAAQHLQLTPVSPFEPDPQGVHWWANATRDDWRRQGVAALRVWQVVIVSPTDQSVAQQLTLEPADKALAAAVGYGWPPRTTPRAAVTTTTSGQSARGATRNGPLVPTHTLPTPEPAAAGPSNVNPAPSPRFPAGAWAVPPAGALVLAAAAWSLRRRRARAQAPERPPSAWLQQLRRGTRRQD